MAKSSIDIPNIGEEVLIATLSPGVGAYLPIRRVDSMDIEGETPVFSVSVEGSSIVKHDDGFVPLGASINILKRGRNWVLANV